MEQNSWEIQTLKNLFLPFFEKPIAAILDTRFTEDFQLNNLTY